MTKLLDIKFTSPNEIARRALKKGLQIRANLESAVAETVLLGVTRIAMDTPVDTGRARAAIAGDFGNMVEIAGPGVRSDAVADGRRNSLTYLRPDQLEGQVGGHLEYLRHLEFGHAVVVRAVTGRKYAKREGGKVKRVPGRAMFRKNIPVIRAYFRRRCRLAVQRGLRGEMMGGED